jgi:mitochondrial import receptor subunit TOM40
VSQSVTKNLSLGTEAFWLGQQRKSGVGVVARYDTKKMVSFFVCNFKLYMIMM